jgi:hypothetical protein
LFAVVNLVGRCHVVAQLSGFAFEALTLVNNICRSDIRINNGHPMSSTSRVPVMHHKVYAHRQATACERQLANSHALQAVVKIKST